jgi:hypothetical protein
LRQADELLPQFDLADAAHRPVRTYSGGMRRRLDLAARCTPPASPVLDDPAGLDHGRGLQHVIEGLVADGTTLLNAVPGEAAGWRTTSWSSIRPCVCQRHCGRAQSQLGATIVEVGFADDETAPSRARAVQSACATPT